MHINHIYRHILGALQILKRLHGVHFNLCNLRFTQILDRVQSFDSKIYLRWIIGSVGVGGLHLDKIKIRLNAIFDRAQRIILSYLRWGQVNIEKYRAYLLFGAQNKIIFPILRPKRVHKNRNKVSK